MNLIYTSVLFTTLSYSFLTSLSQAPIPNGGWFVNSTNCTLYITSSMRALRDGRTKVSFDCELNGDFYSMNLSEAQTLHLNEKMKSGDFVSGMSILKNVIREGNESLRIQSPSVEVINKNNPMASSDGMLQKGSNWNNKFYGDKYVLGIRVIATDHSPPDTVHEISNNIFGTGNDQDNLKTQTSACSYGQLNMIPGANPGKGQDISEHEVAPGMIEVNIDIPLEDSSKNTVQNAVIDAANKKLGFNLPGPFDHVMIILENCYQKCQGISYGIVNGYISVYYSNNYSYAFVQLHEIFHNLGFSHSGGLDGNPYTDHTCVMGNPFIAGGGEKMCFNAAKNWELGWYDYSYFDSSSSSCWSGSIIGLGEWNNGIHNLPVVVKIETNSKNDYFLQFNRNAGPNAQNIVAHNEIMIIIAEKNGQIYGQSFLKAHLIMGESYSIPNWKGTGKDLVVTATNIDITVTPAIAEVTISLGDGCTKASDSFQLRGSFDTNCISCNDEPLDAMKNDGFGCANYDNLKQECQNNSNWIINKTCQQSCYNIGNGYAGDVCCNSMMNVFIDRNYR